MVLSAPCSMRFHCSPVSGDRKWDGSGKCQHTDANCGSIEFSGLIRCTFGPSKFSFVHISFDAFTIIRQCEQMSSTPIIETKVKNENSDDN